MKSNYTTIIIGGGAAGLMCAKHLNCPCLVIDFAEELARKVSISGGGCCNFTNQNISSDHYVSSNPHFCRSALSKFTPRDICILLEKAGIKYELREDGKFFAKTSKDIVKYLTSSEADFSLKTEIFSVPKVGSSFEIITNRGRYWAENLVVATGGLSIPELKVSDLGYQIGRQFGLEIEETSAALVRLDFNRELSLKFRALAGVSLPVEISVNSKKIRESLLFTHYGLSGPAVLQSSLYWDNKSPMKINFLPDFNWEIFWKEHQKYKLWDSLEKLMPTRLVPLLCNENNLPITNISNARRKVIESEISSFIFEPQSIVQYSKAEVTKGGVGTRKISSQTMEVKDCPGLFFIGEVLDVTGELGGYNLHWAWASAMAAARYINCKIAQP